MIRTALCLLSIALILPAQDRAISFKKDIQPVFEKSCWNCHSNSVQLSKLSLATREAALKGGEHGASIVPGSAEKSRLYRLVAGLDKPSMPIGGKISPEEIEAFRLWINQGAVWEGAAPVITTRADPLQDAPIRPEERNYWAFKNPMKPALPIASTSASKCRLPIAFTRTIMTFVLTFGSDFKKSPAAPRASAFRLSTTAS